METSKSNGKVGSQKSGAIIKGQYTDTRYEYANSNGERLIIENSLPKGGLKYMGLDGKKYVYAVFWTRIVNETATPFEVSIDVPADSFKIAAAAANPFDSSIEAAANLKKRPALPDNYFSMVLPSEEMTTDKAPLFNYGLQDIKAALDHSLQQSSSLHRTITPKATRFIYVVILSTGGGEGTIRAGFNVRDDKLYYRVNEKEIYCGQFNSKNLTLQK